MKIIALIGFMIFSGSIANAERMVQPLCEDTPYYNQLRADNIEVATALCSPKTAKNYVIDTDDLYAAIPCYKLENNRHIRLTRKERKVYADGLKVKYIKNKCKRFR